jgi:hypothetical protein
MGRFTITQNNFSVGEIDPLLRARVDLQQYQNGLAKATNVFVQPQGGLQRRPGLAKIIEVSVGSPANGIRLVPFEFSVTDSYLLVFVHQKVIIIKDGILVTNINGSGNDYLTTTITSAQLDQLCWTQSADTMILVNPSLAPQKLVRGATDATWTISTITFDSTPKYPFTMTVTNPAQTLTPSATSGTITLTAGGGTIFSAASVGQYINGTPQGRAKIIGYTSATVVQAVTEYPFFNTTAMASGAWEYETGYEAVWSVTRGYPNTVTFHEGRLFFGGSQSRPSTVWGSKVGIFFDFDPVTTYDDDAVEATLDTNSLNIICDMISGRDLQIFTTGGEFYVAQQIGSPITPTDFFVKTVSRSGTKQGVRVQQLDTGTIHIQRSGQSLNEMLFSDSELSYISNKISLLSSHLLKSPKRMALRRAISTNEGDQLLIVNSTDGTLAVYSILRAQNVIAPSEYITVGDFIDVAVDVTDVYVATKRTFNAVNKYYIELFSPEYFTDCAYAGGATATVTGLPHVGKTVDIIRDGVVEAQQVVPVSGTITLDRASTTDYEVGLPITVYARTLPIEPKMSVGSRTSFKKRLVEVTAVVNETQDLIINQQQVQFRQFGTSVLDSPVAEFTGSKTMHGFLGYSDDAAIEIEQGVPLKMTLLGLDYKVSVHGGT